MHRGFIRRNVVMTKQPPAGVRTLHQRTRPLSLHSRCSCDSFRIPRWRFPPWPQKESTRIQNHDLGMHHLKIGMWRICRFPAKPVSPEPSYDRLTKLAAGAALPTPPKTSTSIKHYQSACWGSQDWPNSMSPSAESDLYYSTSPGRIGPRLYTRVFGATSPIRILFQVLENIQHRLQAVMGRRLAN